MGGPPDEAQTLNNIAKVDRSMGEWQAALDAYERAWTLLAPFHQPERKAMLLNNLGYLYDILGEPVRTRQLLEQALALSVAAEAPSQPHQLLAGGVRALDAGHVSGLELAAGVEVAALALEETIAGLGPPRRRGQGEGEDCQQQADEPQSRGFHDGSPFQVSRESRLSRTRAAPPSSVPPGTASETAEASLQHIPGDVCLFSH